MQSYIIRNTNTLMSHLVESRHSFMAVDLNQSIKHPLVLLAISVSTVLQHQLGLGHPDWIGKGEREDA